MYIIIVGGGKVGFHLARTLLERGHEVLVLERDGRKVEGIREELGSVAMRGDGCEAKTLTEAGAGRADILIAVTGDDGDNLVACQVAKRKFHVARTICLLNNPSNAEIFRILGVDATVSSTLLVLEQIEQLVAAHPLTYLLQLKAQGLHVMEVKIPARAKVVGRRLKDIQLPPESAISLILNRERGAQVPTPETVLAPEDEVIAITRVEREAELRAALVG
ncbi:MAG: TrkA family potassium uptake protein [Dehalococcoidia bacterium]|nr:TrkA family potassium uptake protein [Dehalococcoidia bacterium]